jgi:hypothetical protein
MIKDLFLDTLIEFFYFPLWWYSRGLKKAALFCWQRIRSGWRALALSILLKNIFRPMYGQKGVVAYLLSLNTHLWQISWRFILMAGWFIFWFLILLAWLFMPILIIWQL